MVRSIVNGQSLYEGEWQDNKPHGLGRLITSNGEHWTGEFNKGKKHAQIIKRDQGGDCDVVIQEVHVNVGKSSFRMNHT